MSRVITAPGILKNVQGQINRLADIYDDVKDNNLKPLTITLDPVENASGAVSVTTSDARVTEDMKAIAIEVGTPEVFKAPVTVATGSGTVTLTCTNASGTSTVTVTFIKTSPVEGGEDYPPAVTSTEFDILADRIGSLSSLDTEVKTNLVSAVNEVVGDIEELDSKFTKIESVQEIYGNGTINDADNAPLGYPCRIYATAAHSPGAGIIITYGRTSTKWQLFFSESKISCRSYSSSTWTSWKNVSLS